MTLGKLKCRFMAVRPLLLFGLMALTIAAISSPRGASARERLTVGVLKFGTVNWQLDTVKTHHLDEAEDVSVELLPLASTNATSVALQAGEVDLIVSDWIWVMRQRAGGADLVFAPYSNALGALVVGAHSGIESIKDLAGKRIGVAGGPLDKSWIILQAWSQRRMNFDIGQSARPVFGAPPLLSEQLRRGDLHAVLTFWPEATRLEAQDFRRLVNVEDLLTELGIDRPIALVGYVFREALARERHAAIRGFFAAVAAANSILLASDEEWTRLRPIMKAESDREFEGLKARFRAGIPQSGTAGTISDTERLYRLLAERGGDELLGARTRFDQNAFWNPKVP
jgi:NitT/TauT family transport system substrate-binding protein